MCDNHSHDISVGEKIMSANDMLAAHNRAHLDNDHVLGIEMLNSGVAFFPFFARREKGLKSGSAGCRHRLAAFRAFENL